MVAFMKPEAVPLGLPLLLEPDAPVGRVPKGTTGWRREGTLLVRNHSEDGYGALVQHAIVRYLVHGVQRQQIARETDYSERQIQDWISGRVAYYYAEPVRRALREMGISMGRGGVSEQTSGKRACEVLQACLGLIAQMQPFMPPALPHAREIKTMARLMTAGREPLGPAV